jgi:hypothetical protein
VRYATGELSRSKWIERPKRRHSSETRMNVHTECGRHSDDWLFGGFSVAGVKSLLWGKKGGKAKGKARGKSLGEEENERWG